MPASVNKADLIGNVGRDPEIRTFANGDRVANFSVATSESWKDKATGDRKEKTQWHNVSVLNQPLVDIVERFVRKGDKIYVSGMVEYQKYVDKSTGQERISTQIVLRPYRGEICLMGGAQQQREGSAGATPSRAPANLDLDDEIPF